MNTQTLKQASNGRSEVFKLHPDLVKERPNWNERIDYGDIDQLAALIEESGLLQPLIGSWDKEKGFFFVTDGYRRLRAIRKLIAEGKEIKTVKVIVEERGYNDEKRLCTQLVANSGKPFTPVEKARVIEKLLNFGWSQSDIAKRLGCTQANVSNINAINAFPQKAKDLIQMEALSASEVARMKRESKDDAEFNQLIDEAEKIFRESGKKVTKKTAPKSQKEQKKEGKENNEQQNSAANPNDGSESDGGAQSENVQGAPEDSSQSPGGNEPNAQNDSGGAPGANLKPSKKSKNDALIFLRDVVRPSLIALTDGHKGNARLEKIGQGVIDELDSFLDE